MEIDTSDLTFSDNQTPAPEAPATPQPASAPLDAGLTFTDEDNSPQTVWDEGRGQAFEVPKGLSGRAVDQQIGVSHEQRHKADYFGLVDLGKGFAQDFLTRVPRIVSGTLTESGEVARKSAGWADNIFKFMPMMQGLTRQLRQPRDISNPLVAGPVDTATRLGFDLAQQAMGRDKSMADFQMELGQELSAATRDFMMRHEFTPTNPDSHFSKFMYNAGSGASSVATSIGLLYATKNPAVIAGLFGAEQKASIYEEARAQGIHPILASGISSIAGGIEGGIEAIGAFAFLKAATLNNVLKVTFARAGEQALEEMAQQTGEEALTKITGVRDQSLMEAVSNIGYAGLLGFILGVPAGGVTAVAEKMGLKEELVNRGIPESRVDELISKASAKTLENGQFQEEVRRVMRDELSAESFSEAERLNGLREVNKAYDEIEANLQLEFAKELGADEMKTKLAEEMARVDESIKGKIEQVVSKVEDTTLKGRTKELIKNSDAILSEIDALEAKKADMEAKSKASTSVDKRIEALVKKHDQIDQELSGIVGTESGLKDKIEKRRRGVRIDLLARRAEAIVREIDALEAGQKAVRDLQKASDVKVSAKIEERLQQLTDQYNAIDEELAGLLIDRNAGAVEPSQLLNLKQQDMKVLTKKLGKVMEEVRERIQLAQDRIDAKIDKAFAKLANKVATIARINEKKRIHESLKLLRQIRTADIQNITIKERKEINKLQAELRSLSGSPTIDQLRSFNDRIQLIKEEGKRKLGEIMDQRRARRDAQKELLLMALGVDPEAEQAGEPYITSDRTKKAPVKKRLNDVRLSERAGALSPIRLLEMIDGLEDGIWKQLFIDQVNRATDKKLMGVQEGTARGLEILAQNNISLDELGSKLTVEGFPKSFTMSEAMHIYAAIGNDLNLLALTQDNLIPVDVINAIEQMLPQKFKDAASEFVAEMARHAPRVNLAVLNYTDGKEELPLVEGVRVPMHRDMDPNQERGIDQMGLLESLETQADYRKQYVSRSLTKERVRRGDDVQLKPIRLGMVEVYMREVENREHFIALGRAVKDLNALLEEPKIKQALLDTFGPDVKNAVQDYVNRVAVNGATKASRAHHWFLRHIDRLARSSRQTAAFLYLGYNVVSVAKVPISILAAVGRVSPLHLMRGIQMASMDWGAAQKMAYAKDPQLAAAEFSKEQQELKDPLKGLESKNLVTQTRRHAFDLMRMVDQHTRVFIWLGAYEQAKDLKLSEEEAVRFAQETVLRTQPATNQKDLPGLFATNSEVINMALQFTHQLSQNYGVLTHDLPRAWKGGRKQAAMAMGVGLVLQSLLEYALSTGELPLEPEDWTEAMIQGFLMSVPGLGPMFNAMHNGFDAVPPGLGLVLKTAAAPIEIGKNVVEGDFTKALDNAFYLGSVFGKLPYTQLRRSITGAYELATGETDDFRRLVWSNYQLDQ